MFFPIKLPPLRERRTDIRELVEHFAGKLALCQGKSIREIPKHVIEPLKRHSWPGNIRELQNFMERALIMTTGSAVRPPVAELGTEVAGPLTGRTLIGKMKRLGIWRENSAIEGQRRVVASCGGAWRTFANTR